MTIRPNQVAKSEQKLAAVSYSVANQYLAEGSVRMWSYHMANMAEHAQSARRILFTMLGDDPFTAPQAAETNA